MDVQTDNAFGKPGDNFFVSRYSRDVFRRSRVGALFINKESVDGSAHYNRTMGVDGNFTLGSNFQVNSYLAKTDTNPDMRWTGGRPIGDGQDLAFYGRVAYRDPNWNLWLNYLDVQENFNAEAGFVQRTGIRTTKAYFSPTPRPKRGRHQGDGADVRAHLHHRPVQPARQPDAPPDARHDAARRLVHQRDLPEAPRRARPAVPHPARRDHPGRRLQHGRVDVHLQHQPGRAGSTSASPGSRPTSTAAPAESLAYAFGARATSRLSSELQYNRNDVKMPWGDFLVNLTTLRVDYTFSPRMTIRSLTQFNTSTNEISNNIRFNLIHRPGSDLYVVYNDLRQTGPAGRHLRAEGSTARGEGELPAAEVGQSFRLRQGFGGPP